MYFVAVQQLQFPWGFDSVPKAKMGFNWCNEGLQHPIREKYIHISNYTSGLEKCHMEADRSALKSPQEAVELVGS